MSKKSVKRGDLLTIKPECRAPGDTIQQWIALEDEHEGRVTIAGLIRSPLLPSHIAGTYTLEHLE